MRDDRRLETVDQPVPEGFVPPTPTSLLLGAPTVPRRATFDDLRVGQLVAVHDPDPCEDMEVYGGILTFVGTREANGVDFAVSRLNDAAVVWVLRDAPTSPVTVRREDYDALVALVNSSGFTAGSSWVKVHRAVRALIDNTNTGSDHAE